MQSRNQLHSNNDAGGRWFPEELSFQILARLRNAASVARFRCVSKSWRRLLSYPDFFRKFFFSSSYVEEDEAAEGWQVLISHPSRSRSRTTTTFSIHSYDTLRPVSSGTLPGSGYQSIVGFSDGIFCISDYNGEEISLWNPSTSETKLLPSLRDLLLPSAEATHVTGFGFDPVTGDHKVVARHYDHRNFQTTFVYSLRNGYDSWRNLDDSEHNNNVQAAASQVDYCTRATYKTRVRYHPCTSRIERFHWWTRGRSGWATEDGSDNANNSLIKFTTFDMSRETFTELGLPMPTGERLRCMHENSFHMGRDGSSLIVVLCGMDYDDDEEEVKGGWLFKVWAALDYVALGRGECSWIRLHNVRFDDPTPSCLAVLGFWKHGKWFAHGWFADYTKKGFGVVDTEKEELNSIDDVEIKGDGSHLDYYWGPFHDSIWGFQPGHSTRSLLEL